MQLRNDGGKSEECNGRERRISMQPSVCKCMCVSVACPWMRDRRMDSDEEEKK